MEDPPLNPSQQVERIREILIGRQMDQVEERLSALEEMIKNRTTGMEEQLVREEQATQSSVQEDAQEFRRQLEGLCRNINQHDEELQQNLSAHLEKVNSAMAARIDARMREVFQHLQSEIVQWKNQMDREFHSLREDTVSRTELKNRFARIASAAMEEDPKPDQGSML
jgi:hemerythrin-like domain-containing protein